MITLVVENGTGLANANAYVDVDFVDDYSDTILGCIWKDNVSKQNLAIVNASRFIDMRYQAALPATPLTTTQALLWPRKEFCDVYGNKITAGTIPKQLKLAVAEAAIMFIENGKLELIHDTDNVIKSKTVKIGGAIEESVDYFSPKQENIYVMLDSYMSSITYPNRLKIHSMDVVRG